MRAILTLALFAGLTGALQADDKKPAAKAQDDEKKPTLKVGDQPPALEATKWFQGGPIKAFEPGKTYVVEFWATWCGPCIAIMPHVATLQREFKDQGVTVVGFTAKDPNNTAEKVAEFIEKRGPKLNYTFAFADNRDTYDAYMKAAGQNGIPCSFVIGKDGKIAYIGHPLFLDEVLPYVVAGTWDPKAGAEELAKADADFDKVFKALNGQDVEAGMKALTEFDAHWPRLANNVYMVAPRLSLLIRAKKFDEARAMADKVIAQTVAQDDAMLLRQVAGALRMPAARGDKPLMLLAVTAAEAALKMAGDKDLGALLSVAEAHALAGDANKGREFGKKAVVVAEAAVAKEGDNKNSMTLLRLAEAHFAAGDKAKAKEAAQQAVEAAPNEAVKKRIKSMTEKFDPPAKEDNGKSNPGTP